MQQLAGQPAPLFRLQQQHAYGCGVANSSPRHAPRMVCIPNPGISSKYAALRGNTASLQKAGTEPARGRAKPAAPRL